mgnify:FL=1|jgi:hypothetical protein
MSEIHKIVADILDQLATKQSLISYKNLADCVGINSPRKIYKITKILENLIIEDHINNRPLLSALVVGRGGLPGRGFFQLCKKINRYFGPDTGPQATVFHELEKKLVYNSKKL